MRDAWERTLCQRDNRSSDAGSQEHLEMAYADTSAHRTMLNNCWADGRVALGASMDGRAYEWLNKTYGPLGGENKCICGMENPSRRHWLNECTHIPGFSAIPTSTTGLPTCQMEESLAVRLTPIPRPPPDRARELHVQSLVNELLKLKRGGRTMTHIASDGGIQEPTNPKLRIGACATVPLLSGAITVV